MTRMKSTYLALVAVLLSPVAVNADDFISFDSVPTDTTYIGSGLLLSSNSGSYIIGSCGNQTPGSDGCLGSDSFRGELTFTFVELGSLIPAVTDSFEIILCEGCNFRGSSAQVFDKFGGLLSTIDMNTASGLGNRTFSLAMAGIGSLVVDLGTGSDGVQSLSFGTISSTDPEPDTRRRDLYGAGNPARRKSREFGVLREESLRVGIGLPIGQRVDPTPSELKAGRNHQWQSGRP